MAASVVPRLDSENIAIPGARVRVNADADAFGALEARAMGRVSQGLANVATTAEKVDDEFNEANARDLATQYLAKRRERFYDSETGYLSTARGAGALERRQEVEAGLQQDADDLLGLARSPRARALAQEQLSRSAQEGLNSVATHVAQEARTYQNERSEARILEAQNGAVAAWGDEAAVRANIATGVAEIEGIAERDRHPEEWKTNRIRAFTSDVNTSVIQQMAVSNPQDAEALFERIRPSLDAQAAGALRTTMREAQRGHEERVEGMGWQAFAAGRPLSSIDPAAYRELTSNPLLGQSFARLTEAYRTRAQSYANGAGRVRDNSPTYLGLLNRALSNDPNFTRQGWLETQLAANADALSPADMGRLLLRRSEMQGGPNAGAVNMQQQAYNAVRGVAAPLLGDYGLDLSPGNARGRQAEEAREGATAFDRALMQEVLPFVEQNRRLPNGVETQELIGRAIVRLPAEQVAAPLRVRGSRGRTEGGATTAAVVPFDLIPRDARREIVLRYQNTHGGRQPSVGHVEATYARFLAESGR